MIVSIYVVRVMWSWVYVNVYFKLSINIQQPSHEALEQTATELKLVLSFNIFMEVFQ